MKGKKNKEDRYLSAKFQSWKMSKTKTLAKDNEQCWNSSEIFLSSLSMKMKLF